MVSNEDPKFSNPNYLLGKWLSSAPPGEEVVISGIAGQFPNSHNIQEFRDNLYSKTDMIDADTRRWEIDHPEIPKRIGKIYDIDKVDAGFFNLHYRQATSMDPTLRVLLENVIEAILDAGVNPMELKGTKTGVFVSVSTSDTENSLYKTTIEPQRFPVTGSLKSVMANRISFFLKVKGPSLNVDTACSSSLNALDNAFRAIRNGSCDQAIVTAGNLLLLPGSTLQFFRLGVLSFEGRCKVFDQDASGYVRSETIASVFLQKARDSNRIYTQIVNIKVNSDGYKDNGITFPSAEAQKDLMSEIYDESNVHPSELSYLEAHGTGTQVGDIEEVQAIDLALAQNRTTPLMVGSVKSNIGHTEPCSGLCSLVKVILAMETNKIAPNINLNNLKKGLKGFEEKRMVAVLETTDLEEGKGLIGVNNFGFGGNNAHVILKRFHQISDKNGLFNEDLPRLVCVSGRISEAVVTLLNNIHKHNMDKNFISLIQKTYEKNINGHLFRGYTILDSQRVVKNSYNLLPEKRPFLYIYFGDFENDVRTLGESFLTIPTFKSTFKRINVILKFINIDLMDNLKKYGSQLENLLVTAAVQLSIADLLSKLELECTAAYGGNSLGKIVASFYHNNVTLEEAIFDILKINEKLLENDRKNSLHNFQNDGSMKETDLKKIFKKHFVMNFSDIDCGKSDFKVTNLIEFLNSLGRLYEQGFNFNIQKLYQEFKFPVNRGTPMVSPLIKWNHKRIWKTFKWKQSSVSNWKYISFSLTLLKKEYQHIEGHVVDGRNLIPATEYLHLVWKSFADNVGLKITDCKVIFENCRFMRSTMMSKTGFSTLTVAIQQGTGCFEVLENEKLVVNGKVALANKIQNIINLPITDLKNDSKEVLQHDEIYRQLYLRGYNYSGVFKGIMKMNNKGTSSLIKWEDNWTAYMDKMLQMKIFQMDSRLLFVPVSIQRLVIDPLKHLEVVANAKGDFIPAYSYIENNKTISGGIEISGLQAKSIARKRQPLEPVLEKQEFIQCKTSLNIAQAMRVNAQIILENSLENNFKAVEIIDNSKRYGSEFLLSFISQSLDDIPLVNPHLTIATKDSIESIPGIEIEDVTLKPDSNFLLIIGSNVLEKLSTLKTLLIALNPNGYILSRENLDFIYDASAHDEMVELFTEYTTNDEKLLLLKKRKPKTTQTTFIEINENLEWIKNVQNSIKEKNTDVVVYAKNSKPNGILGFINCIRREPGGNKVKCFFTFDEDFKFKLEEYSQKTEMSINIFKNFQKGTYRHLPLDNVGEMTFAHCFINNTVKGDLSSLNWLQGPLTPKTPLKDNKVLVYTYYSALNFRDIMLASGRIGVEALTPNRIEQESLLGLEFSGKDLNGRKIAGMVTGQAIATMVTADSNFFWNIPGHWTMEDAATIPAVYSTVIYALLKVAKLRRASSILIHSAAGGIGLAAINVCRHFDCELFLTVGTKEKRDYIKQQFPEIADDHIGNSRDTTFEEMVQQSTKSRGVDIVLNSLSEDKLKASIRCLTKGGYFLEIGKFDLANNNSLQLQFFEKEISYHGVMLDHIYQTSEKIKKELHQMIEDGIQIGYVKPLPRILFTSDKVKEAFKYMSRGQHIGKVLIKVRDENEETNVLSREFRAIPRFNCDLVKTYVIIGGLGGFGLELADWLVLRGARKLILSSRTGISTGYQTQRINIWRSYGVTVHVNTNDVTKEEGCFNLIEEATILGSVDAVFNLAVVLQDALFEDQTEEMFRTALAPKAQVTNFLDVVTRVLCPQLRYFVVFSSVSCGRGNIGQTNYGMGNSIMERICEIRKNDGLPALAIQWGAIGDVGLVAKMQKENKELVIGGTLQQKMSSCFEALDKFLIQDSSVVSSMLVAVKDNKSLGILTATDAVASILGIKNLKTISKYATLAELGMDSMRGTEIIQVLEKDFDIYVTSKDVRSLSFAKLAELEVNKEGVGEKNESKAEFGAIFLNQYMPDNRLSGAALISKMKSKIQDEEHMTTVFILPGIEGFIKPLELFVKELEALVYGIQYDYQNPENSIEDFASNIIQKMEPLLSKENTFNIVGYSFGVNVGLEIVHLLEEKGYRGQLLAIDGSPSYLKHSIKKQIPTENETEFETMLLFKLLSFIMTEEVLLQNKENIMKCQNFIERVEFGISLIPSDVIKNMNIDSQGAVMILKRLKALLQYDFVHQKVKSSVFLLKAEFPMVEDGEDYGLSEICEKAEDVTILAGNHASILESPDLAGIITELMKLNSA